jgi:phage terminase large subunit-like protein
MTQQWSTALPDWQERIVAGRSLVPCGALFPDEAEKSLAIFRGLRIVDAPGSPTIGECCEPWVIDLVDGR